MALPSLTATLNFFEKELSASRVNLLSDSISLFNLLTVIEIAFAGLYLALGASAEVKAIARKLMAVQVFITYLEFLLIASAGFILIPFGIFKPTAFLAERVFGAIISFGIKLMVLALIIGISDKFLATVTLPGEVHWDQAINLSVIALAQAFLALHAPGVAQSLLNGSPHLSAGTIVATAAGTAYVGAKAATALTGGAGALAAVAGAAHAGGTMAAASLGGASKESSLAGKVANVATKGAMYALGGAGGITSGAVSEFASAVGFGQSNNTKGSRGYREKIGDPTLAGAARGGKGGLLGNFNAGLYSVPDYRNNHEAKQKAKSEKTDQDNLSSARKDASGNKDGAKTEKKSASESKDGNSKDQTKPKENPEKENQPKENV